MLNSKIRPGRLQAAADDHDARSLLNRIREVVFTGSDPNEVFTELRQLLAENWSKCDTPGRVFDLIRHEDLSDVSGTGRVAEGIEFQNGKVALCWLGRYSSVNLYDSIDHVRHIHGHGGRTEVKFR